MALARTNTHEIDTHEAKRLQPRLDGARDKQGGLRDGRKNRYKLDGPHV